MMARYQGKITQWKDGQGFGFITPTHNADTIFVHIKSFPNQQRRPVLNELVTYELTTDNAGRQQAVKVAFVKNFIVSDKFSGYSNAPLVIVAAFFMLLAELALQGTLPFMVLGIYAIASSVTFVAYALDKSAAKQNKWRTAEATLHIFALVGGWPGALVAQRWLRHKSKKLSFQIVFWMTVLLNCLALAYSYSFLGTALDYAQRYLLV
jgi:uncharacterized membrane protein YsdA (DUF1294 family)/cold shock CspA family protein